MSRFEVGDFIVAQEAGGQPDFGVVVKISQRRTILCEDTTHYDMLSVRCPTGIFISFVDECQPYREWLDEQA